MRDIPPELQAKLDQGVTSLCWCWTITRQDGQVFHFTDHDRPIHFNAAQFEPGQSLNSVDIEKQLGLAPDSGELSGILDSSAIAEQDLASGLFDEAKVEIFRVDWSDPSLFVPIWTAWFGQISRDEYGFRAQLYGPSAKLDKNIGRVFTRRCNAELGDTACGLDLTQTGFQFSVSLTQEAGRNIQFSGLESVEDGFLSGGVLHWDGGPNMGREARILLHRAPRIIELDSAPVFEPQIGDDATLFAGCDKSWTTCRDKFSNLLQFRGFPDLIGIDAVAQTPAENIAHDGGSRRSPEGGSI